jgi:hypothetical protein
LKEFLWKEGYQGGDDTSPTVQVYPPRKFAFLGKKSRTESPFSARDVYAWSKTPLGKVKVVILGQGASFLSLFMRTLLKVSASQNQTHIMAEIKRTVRILLFLLPIHISKQYYAS